MILLDKNQIISFLHIPSSYQLDLEVLETISSTNDYLANKNISDLNTIALCLAEEQTNGKGRLGRKWFSPANANIYLSIAYLTNKKVNELSELSIDVAHKVRIALEEYGIKNIAIKHPNDLVYQCKKLAGILIETSNIANDKTKVIIGIGLNVNMPTLPTNDIDQPWTAVNQIIPGHHDRNKIAALLIQRVMK